MVVVWMVTYNHGDFIEKAIESVMMQKTTFKYKLLIGEDNSKDNTREICKNLQKKYPDKIELFLHDENIGPTPNAVFVYEKCFKSGAKYIALLEGDDYWTDPHKLQKQVDFLEANLDYVVCYHDAIVVNDCDEKVKESLLPLKHKVDYNGYELKTGAWLLPLTMCYRNVINEFPPEFSKVFNGDTFLISMLGCFGKGKWINNIQPASYRMHDGGVWSSKTVYQRILPQIKTFGGLLSFYKVKKDKDLISYFDKARFNSGLKLIEEAFRLKSFILIIKSYILVLIQCDVINSISKIIFFHKFIFKLIYSKIKK